MADTQVLIVAVNDCELWIGESVEACVAAAAKEYGHDDSNDPSDMEQYKDAYALNDEQLDRLRYVDADENEQPTGETRTFREQLAREVAEGGEFPRLFAATDY